MSYKRYKMLQKYINGEPQEEYKQGELISNTEYSTLEECNEGNQNPDTPIEGEIYQWVTISGEYVCSGYDKYTKEKEQRSSDNGATWTDTGRTRQGSLMDDYSEDCGYVPPIPPTPGDYLTFVARESGTFTLSRNAVSYSLDEGETWVELAADTASPTVTNGSKIMWKGTLTPTTSGIGTFSATGNFNVQGNPMSLLYGDNFIGQTDLTEKSYAFYSLFYQNTKVINAKNLSLPATTLVGSCYQRMFYGCTSLMTAPVLPATTLASMCYDAMFKGCTSLMTAPELPATTLEVACYSAMFMGCTSLTTAPELPATTLQTWCYEQMFRGCTSLNYIKAMFTTTPSDTYTKNWVVGVSATGTFVKNSAAQWDVTGVNGIPSGWNVING